MRIRGFLVFCLFLTVKAAGLQCLEDFKRTLILDNSLISSLWKNSPSPRVSGSRTSSLSGYKVSTEIFGIFDLWQGLFWHLGKGKKDQYSSIFFSILYHTHSHTTHNNSSILRLTSKCNGHITQTDTALIQEESPCLFVL